MATIIVEDGTGKSTANSYITTAELDTFCADRNITLTATYGDQSEVLIKAKDYMETLCYIGDKYTKDQALEWPRSGVEIDGFGYLVSEIPQRLKDGQAWLAVSIDAGVDPFETLDRIARREKLDTMEIEYATGAASRQMITSFNSTIAKLLCNGGSMTSFKVYRS